MANERGVDLEHTAWKQGYRDRLTGVEYDNPYPRYSDLWGAYLDGWAEGGEDTR